MQEHVVEVIRELMKTQGMSIRKISAEIAKEHGGSALGYTQQINRILNDPAYDPNFSTVEKILSALKSSVWQTTTNADIKHIETRLDQLSDDMAEMKGAMRHLNHVLHAIAIHLKTSELNQPSK